MTRRWLMGLALLAAACGSDTPFDPMDASLAGSWTLNLTEQGERACRIRNMPLTIAQDPTGAEEPDTLFGVVGRGGTLSCLWFDGTWGEPRPYLEGSDLRLVRRDGRITITLPNTAPFMGNGRFVANNRIEGDSGLQGLPTEWTAVRRTGTGD